jgi:hypothetical protein
MKEMKSENCAPGCNCGKPSGNTKVKAVVCIIVLLVICGIFVYKAKSAKQSSPTKTETAFTAPIANEANSQEPTVKSVGDKKIVGEFLDSLASLNKVAINQDAVFVFIPAMGEETVSKETIAAIASAEQKIKSAGASLGLYTLRFSSPSKEYANLAAQLTLPAMLVMSKGRGVGTVSGEITETKLLQAYVASSRAGGCGPSSSCGPSTPGCGPSAPALGPRL